MTDTAERIEVGTDAVGAVTAWLEENWDPELTVGEWWERLGLSGWAAPGLPENAYGKGLNRNDAVAVQKAIADFGALGAPGGLGLLLAAPTIATHGTQEQIDLYVRDIVTGQKAWCQLFSEPGAGSDLAGLQTQAVKDGERVDHQRPEGVDVRRAGRRPRHAHRPHRPRRAEAPGHHLVRLRHAPAGRRDPAAARR